MLDQIGNWLAEGFFFGLGFAAGACIVVGLVTVIYARWLGE
jgi:hypothetical protein